MRSRSVAARAFSAVVAGTLISSSSAALRPAADDGASLEVLRWMSGHWRQENGSVVEEVWMPPAGGLMLGANRTVPRRGAATFEFLRIEQRDDGLFYVASPGGGRSTAFRLTEADEHHARFENPEHDFPKVIEYSLEDEGQLRARVSGDDGPGGTWLFEKAAELD